MSLKRIILASLMIGVMCNSMAQASTSDKVFKSVAHFFPGYLAGVTPIMWPPILHFLLTDNDKRFTVSDRIFITAGFATGFAVLGLAVYGLKKLLETKKVDNKENTTQLI